MKKFFSIKFGVSALPSRRGSTLVEVIIATGIVALIMTSLVAIMTVSLKNTATSKVKLLASKHSQEAVELFRQQRSVLGWDTMVSMLQADGATAGGNSVIYCLPTIPATSAEFQALSNQECSSQQYLDSKNLLQRYADVGFTQADGRTQIDVKVYVKWMDGGVTRESVSSQTFEDYESLAQKSVISLPTIPTPVPTPVPTALPSPSSPACTKPSKPGTITPSGYIAKGVSYINWDASTGASYYWLKLDDLIDGWTGGCGAYANNTWDLCTTVGGGGYGYNFKRGRWYTVTVTAVNSCGESEATTGSIMVY